MTNTVILRQEAAYARVSANDKEPLTNYEAQAAYYKEVKKCKYSL